MLKSDAYILLCSIKKEILSSAKIVIGAENSAVNYIKSFVAFNSLLKAWG